MSEGRRFTTFEDAMSFLQAGNATVTVVSTVTKKRYTYRVKESKDGRVFFVSVLFGADNETQYVYIGIIKDGEFRWTQKSGVVKNDPRWRAFDWTYRKLSAGELPDVVEVYHEGKCGRCGRKLTVPESIESGLGPECRTKSKHKPGQEALPW